MSKHLSGSKRLAVIQRWVNGYDDPEWEVLPTRKEGKYIVKKRETPIEDNDETEEIESKTSEKEEIEETEKVEEIEETPQTQKPPKPNKTQQMKIKVPKVEKTQQYDPTINLEILNQLKLFGEEIKNKREKKEQKKMIKDVVYKQMNKVGGVRMQTQYPPEYIYTQTPNIISQPEPETSENKVQPPLPPPQQQPITFQRRNRIFDDLIG